MACKLLGRTNSTGPLFRLPVPLSHHSKLSFEVRFGANNKAGSKARRLSSKISRGKKQRPNEESGKITEALNEEPEATLESFTLTASGSASVTEDESSLAAPTAPTSANRQQVMNACIITSIATIALSVSAREGSHWASLSGFPVPDASVLMPFDFHGWHAELIFGVVFGVSVARFLLLRAWPDFQTASNVSNSLILDNLNAMDIALVALLTGCSEELMFRGVLLPLVHCDWIGAVVSGIIFGALHISGNRNAAFAIWASFVGVSYGLVGLWSNDLLVPMAAHSVSNYVAAYMWKLQKEV